MGVQELGRTPKRCDVQVRDEWTMTEAPAAPPGQPSLRDQLSPLTLEQMEERLHAALGIVPRRPSPQEEALMGFKKQRKEELLDALVAAYGEASRRCSPQGAPTVRRYRRIAGMQLDTALTDAMLAALKLVDWSQNTRTGVESSGYVILKQPEPLRPPRDPSYPTPVWPEQDPRLVRRRVWAVAADLIASVPEASSFQYTCLALSKNFVSSPHTDRNDLSVQYLLSLGDFSNGGELCIEEDPFLVTVINTHNRLAKCDGRFPHWVSKYEGERYSVVFFRSHGTLDPPVKALHMTTVEREGQATTEGEREDQSFLGTILDNGGGSQVLARHNG